MADVQLRGVLELLERHHGVGARGDTPPGWMSARIERALEEMAVESAEPLEAVVAGLSRDGERLSRLADVLRVGETSFYRDPAQWDALRNEVVPALSGDETIRALSVGCSTGEEAWSLAMVLEEAGRPYAVVGMDRSEAAVSSARDAHYGPGSARNLPTGLRELFVEDAASKIRVVPTLAPRVRFVVRDALRGPPPGRYDIVLCKNLLIYFGDAAATQIVARLVQSLAEGGVLLVARSEVPRVRGMRRPAREIAPGVVGFS